MNTPNEYIAHTKAWIQKVVIGLNFCPFAIKPFLNESIHYEVVEGDKTFTILEKFILECIRLDQNESLETSFVILPKKFDDFNNYLNLLELAEALLKKEGYEGIYQIASFHPSYKFRGATEFDPSNFTNRSPYPMLHILRESSIEKVIMKGTASAIPQNNILKTNALGLKYMKNIWEECFIYSNKKQ